MTDVTVAFEGWNNSAGGWGNGGWGEVQSLPDGTTALGTVEVQTSVSFLVTGLGATSALGTVVAITNVAKPTGVEGVSSLGTVSVTGAAVVDVTGVSATGYIFNTDVEELVWGIINTDQTPRWTEIVTPGMM